jgi:hypothetical protein
MTEKFESKFHQRYVGGQGEVVEDERPVIEVKVTIPQTTREQVLEEYRKYIRDPKAELPEEIEKTLIAIQRTENDRK